MRCFGRPSIALALAFGELCLLLLLLGSRAWLVPQRTAVLPFSTSLSFKANSRCAVSPTRAQGQDLRLRPSLSTLKRTKSLLVSIPKEVDRGDVDVDDLKKGLTREFVSIGGPAFIQLAAEPLAAIVGTAYLGRLGPAVLGGAGVAVSAQYAVSKFFNDPLLRTSISLVASEDGKYRTTKTGREIDATADNTDASTTEVVSDADRDLSISVSSALLLSATVGLIQMVVYCVFCKGITRSMGVTKASPMWASAVGYLQVRAVGTPAATLWLVANGIFRGLGDTKTPLLYSLFFTSLNAILDPIFIFVFHWGAAGAAAGTAIAQSIALIPLLRALNRKVPIDVLGQFSKLKTCLQQYLRAGGLILFRTLAKVSAYAVCARQAALLGSVAAAAYNITFQLGFATTQICEAVAVAVQTLLARELADTTTHSRKTKAVLIKHLIDTSLWLGGGLASILALVTLWRRDSVLAALTSNVAVQAASANIFPVVLFTQIVKGLAYPVNGIIMGGLDWFYSMVVMWMANVVCVGLVRAFATTTANGVVSLGQIWWALAAFMGTQLVAGMVRIVSKTGVWKALRPSQQQ